MRRGSFERQHALVLLATANQRLVPGQDIAPNHPAWAIKRLILNVAGKDKAVLSNWTLSLLRCGSDASGAVVPAVTHLQDSPYGTITGGGVEPKQHGSTLDA
jgi:hypothetical protein